jgi:hypothetical protein
MIRTALAVGLIVGLVAAPAGQAAAEPSNTDLVLVGLALAPPTYLVGVTLHEGSHALAAKLAGGEVVSVRLFPPGVDPLANKFRFGWVYARGLRTTRSRLFFYLAPKITNTLLLGGYTALVLSDSLPDHRYAQLALAVGATGMWIDFAKDLLAFSPHNDVVKAFRLWCMTGWRQVPARLVYAGLSAGFGYVVARGLYQTFDRSPDDPAAAATRTPVVVPLLSSAF